MKAESEYEQQAREFLAKHGIKFKARYVTHDHYFDSDSDTRDIYYISLSRKGRTTGFKFGQSIHSSRLNEEPKPYDLLACLTKYDPGSHEEFCGDFGYDPDSIKGLKSYRLTVKEWDKVRRFFTASELEELQDIN